MGIKVLAVAEQKNGKLSAVSFESIAAARKLGAELMTACLGESADSLATELASRGGGKVLAVSHASLKYFNDEIYARVITELVKKYQPQLVLGSATFYGKALFSRLAAINDGGMASDITGLRAEGQQIIVTRPAYGGNIILDIGGKEGKLMFATIRPKIFDESKEGDGEVVSEAIGDAAFQSRTSVREMVASQDQTVSLTEADIIVSAGRGIRGPENLPLIKKLADKLGAALGASRAIVDAGWIDYPHQVGQTGKTVNPKLYMAIGISGAIQHLVGMQTSGTIVAINRDKDAPIFDVASYGIVGDLFEIVPALTAKLESTGK
jgi:electron transfer flavoprotein alpha subunit